MSRSKYKPKRSRENVKGAFTLMILSTMDTAAYRALSSTAQALYVWLRMEWDGPDANNNGQIRFSVRQAAQAMGVSLNAAYRAFHDLQAKGFIVLTEHARLGSSGEAKSPAYELTEIAMPGTRGKPRKLFEKWQHGHDFPVHKATANNPTGRNGRKKSHLQNEDSNVIKLKTKLNEPS